VLREVLVDELGEREPLPHPAPAAVLLQRPLQRHPRIRLVSEAAALHPLRVAPAGPVAVRPELAAVASNGSELEYLALLPGDPARRFALRGEPRG